MPIEHIVHTKELLEEHIELTRKEKGCEVFEVEQSSRSQEIFEVYVVFDSKTSFEEHQIRTKKSSWGKFTKDFQRSYEIIYKDEAGVLACKTRWIFKLVSRATIRLET